MKRIIITLLTLALVFVLTAPVSAAHFWKFDTSEPVATNQARTFNLEFVTLSTDAADEFSVKLFQNGVETNTATITTDYGDSGMFTVTVPADGTYEYKMTAMSSVDSTTVTSPTRTVTVKGREIQVVNTGTTAGGGTGGVQSAASGVAGDTNGDGVVDERDEAGQVDDGAASDESDEDVLGQEDRADSDNWLGSILAALAILAAAYYWFFYRQGRVNPFRRNDDV